MIDTYDDYFDGEANPLPKIKKCPFCGSRGLLNDNGYMDPVIDSNGAYVDMDVSPGDIFWIECDGCGAETSNGNSPEEAIEKWNRRSNNVESEEEACMKTSTVSREVIFHGERLDNGKWIEGSLLQYIVGGVLKSFIFDPSGYRLFGDLASFIEVDPKTVGQYIGKNDKYGRKIFDGHILSGFRYPYLDNGRDNYFAEVVWNDDSCAFEIVTRVNPKSGVQGISDGITVNFDNFNSNDWEIIGNIFDNPEFLEG